MLGRFRPKGNPAAGSMVSSSTTAWAKIEVLFELKIEVTGVNYDLGLCRFARRYIVIRGDSGDPDVFRMRCHGTVTGR